MAETNENPPLKGSEILLRQGRSVSAGDYTSQNTWDLAGQLTNQQRVIIARTTTPDYALLTGWEGMVGAKQDISLNAKRFVLPLTEEQADNVTLTKRGSSTLVTLPGRLPVEIKSADVDVALCDAQGKPAHVMSADAFNAAKAEPGRAATQRPVANPTPPSAPQEEEGVLAWLVRSLSGLFGLETSRPAPVTTAPQPDIIPPSELPPLPPVPELPPGFATREEVEKAKPPKQEFVFREPTAVAPPTLNKDGMQVADNDRLSKIYPVPEAPPVRSIKDIPREPQKTGGERIKLEFDEFPAQAWMPKSPVEPLPEVTPPSPPFIIEVKKEKKEEIRFRKTKIIDDQVDFHKHEDIVPFTPPTPTPVPTPPPPIVNPPPPPVVNPPPPPVVNPPPPPVVNPPPPPIVKPPPPKIKPPKEWQGFVEKHVDLRFEPHYGSGYAFCPTNRDQTYITGFNRNTGQDFTITNRGSSAVINAQDALNGVESGYDRIVRTDGGQLFVVVTQAQYDRLRNGDDPQNWNVQTNAEYNNRQGAFTKIVLDGKILNIPGGGGNVTLAVCADSTLPTPANRSSVHVRWSDYKTAAEFVQEKAQLQAAAAVAQQPAPIQAAPVQAIPGEEPQHGVNSPVPPSASIGKGK